MDIKTNHEELLEKAKEASMMIENVVDNSEKMTKLLELLDKLSDMILSEKLFSEEKDKRIHMLASSNGELAGVLTSLVMSVEKLNLSNISQKMERAIDQAESLVNVRIKDENDG